MIVHSGGCVEGSGTTSGTSGGSGASGSSGGASLSVSQVCESYAAKLCNLYQRCIAWNLTYAYGDVATCRARTLIGCAETFVQPVSQAELSSAQDCIDAYDAMSCDDWYADVPIAACNLPGPRSNGQSCHSDSLCQSLTCQQSSISSCGTCAAQIGAGGSCAGGARCGPGLACTNGICTTRGGQGAGCTATSPCAAGLACVAGICGAPVPVGGACNPDGDECSTNGAQFLYCAQGTCTAAAFAAAGQPCGYVGPQYVYCAGFGTCVQPSGSATGACAAAAADGAACNASNGPDCMPPAECMAGTCQLPVTQCN